MHGKLNRTKKGNRTKKALTPIEVRTLLAWLEADKNPRGLEDYAIVFMLVTSSLRASELCQLHYKDLDFIERTWTARFTGKGELSSEQELYGPAVEACRAYFRAFFRRDPRPEDALFWTTQSYQGSRRRRYNITSSRIVCGRSALELERRGS